MKYARWSFLRILVKPKQKTADLIWKSQTLWWVLTFNFGKSWLVDITIHKYIFQELLSTRKLQIHELASVAQACNINGWLLRGARSPAAEELHTHLTTIPLPSLSSIEDSYVWEIDGTEIQNFSTRKTWSMVRNRALEQTWTMNIWFKGHIPRHAFTTWVAFQDRLPTRSRLVDWGMNIPSSCCLCSLLDESRDHLFL